jgi:hypothetical protein
MIYVVVLYRADRARNSLDLPGSRPLFRSDLRSLTDDLLL